VPFYARSLERQGFGEEVKAIQERWQAGDRAGAVGQVSGAMVAELLLVGEVDRIAEGLAAYRRAAVYVQASRHEGFGLAVAEAMLAGCVPVVMDVTAMPEVVGDAGVLIDSQDPGAVAEGVRKGTRAGPRRRAPGARADPARLPHGAAARRNPRCGRGRAQPLISDRKPSYRWRL